MTKEMQKTIAAHFANHKVTTDRIFASAEGEPAAAYVHQEFPKVKYHPETGAVTVNDPREEDALEGHYDSPAKFPKPEAKKK